MTRANADPVHLLVACAVALLLSAGCNSYEAMAREHLTSEGLSDLVLEPKEAKGSFSYRGHRYNDVCVGLIAVEKQRGSSKIDDTVICKPSQAACGPRQPYTCYRLGVLYDEGDSDPMDSTAVDPPLSSLYFDRACDGGHARSCNISGLRHAEGKGVTRSLRQAADRFRRSCDLGYGRGCYNLALSHHNGSGVAADIAQAVKLYDQACRRQVATGCYNLGVIFRDGAGRPADQPRAAKLFAQACRADYLQACVNLGVMATLGQGVAPDEQRAVALFRQACKGGLQTGCDGLERLDVP